MAEEVIFFFCTLFFPTGLKLTITPCRSFCLPYFDDCLSRLVLAVFPFPPSFGGHFSWPIADLDRAIWIAVMASSIPLSCLGAR